MENKAILMILRRVLLSLSIAAGLPLSPFGTSSTTPFIPRDAFGSFGLEKHQSSPVPALLSPLDGSTTPDITPRFNWSAVSAVTGYRIQVDDNDDFDSPVINYETTNLEYAPNNMLVAGTYYWRVCVNTNDWNDCSPFWMLIIDGEPPPHPVLISPPDGSITPDITPPFDWSDVPGADHYRIQVDDDADFSSPAADSQPSNSTYTPSKQLPNGTYYWHVATNDGMENWSAFSPAWHFTVDGAPPPPPILSMPLDGSATPDLTPAFDWSDVPNADHYRIQIDDNADFSSPAADSQPDNSTYTPTNQLPAGTYYWHVRTNDILGNWGDYSLPWTLIFNGAPPPAPTLITPPDSSTTSDLTPVLDWSDISNADHYRIQIDDSADFSSPIADSQPEGSAYTPIKQLPNGTYYWHVQTNDILGNWGDYSPAWALTVNGTRLPSPTLIAPPSGLSTPDFTPPFDWSDVPGACHYRIQVDDNADFSSPIADSQPTGSAYSPGNQLPNGTYYWHVCANDGMGNWGDYSPVWILTVNGVPMPAPALVSPLDGLATTDFTPPFDWSDVPGADHYRIQVDDNADFSSPAADSQPANSTYTPGNQLPVGTYYWHVRTADSMGNWGSYSVTWQVTINGIRLPPPNLLSPPDGLTTPDFTPSFDWNDVSSADHYRIQVDDNADFSSPLADSEPTHSTYTPGNRLPNGAYYWHVRANDGLGNWSDYSPAWRLSVNGVLLPAPALIAPPNGSTTPDLTPVFDWSDVPGADHYRIQVDDNSDFSSLSADSQPVQSAYSPNKQLDSGAYYWRVVAADSLGNWGEYSSVWIVMVNGAPPAAPELISPPDGSTTPDMTPSFDWSDVPDADHYRVQVDDNADFSSPLADSQPKRSAYTPRTRLEAGNDVPIVDDVPIVYYWHVRAADKMGNWGEYSAISSFMVMLAPTETPAPTAAPTAAPTPASTLVTGPVARDTTEPAPVLNPVDKAVYLTFDDGPDPSYTPQLVTHLLQQGIQATFFLTGSSRSGSGGELYITCTPGDSDLVSIDALNGRRVVEIIDEGGFGIGLHGWFHGSAVHPEDMWNSAALDPRMAIAQEENVLAILGISFDRFLRAPGGAFPGAPFPVYQDWYYYGWDVDARDDYGVSPQTIVENVMNGLSDKPNNPVILLHADHPNTLQAIVDPQYDLIGKILALGYSKFARLPRSVDHTSYPPNGTLYNVGR